MNRENLCRVLRAVGVRFAPVRLGRATLWVDLANGLGQYFFIHQRYEPYETSLIAQIAEPGMVVLNIGANIGYYTVLLGAKVGATGRVIAFEPGPTNMRLLQRNIRANRLTNVVCEQAAVAATEGQTALYLSNINDGDHRIYNAQDDARFNAGKPRASAAVHTIVLDKYLETFDQPVDLIVMDIQGAEMLAFPGMIQTLRHPNLVLFCEFWPYALRQAGSDPVAFLQFLTDLEFELFQILEDERRVVPVQNFDLAFQFADPDYANLIAVRRARRRQISFLPE
ncbi:MAG: FkbM family methyltransferase [Chloroflexi bacterium]|nr:FkbM family methyltransferase [Chloroflexota bacterium]